MPRVLGSGSDCLRDVILLYIRHHGIRHPSLIYLPTVDNSVGRAELCGAMRSCAELCGAVRTTSRLIFIDDMVDVSRW